MNTAEKVAVIVLVVSLCGAAVTGLILAARWINGRADAHEAERTAAATFDAEFIPEPADVAGPDAEVDALIGLAHVEDELNGVLAVIDGWRA